MASAPSRLTATPVAKESRTNPPGARRMRWRRLTIGSSTAPVVPDNARPSRAAPPRADQRGALGQAVRLDKEVAEGRVGQIRGGRGQDDLGVARDLELARPVAPVGHGEAPDFDVVLGGDRDVELRRDVTLTAAEHGALGMEGDQILFGLPVGGM